MLKSPKDSIMADTIKGLLEVIKIDKGIWVLGAVDVFQDFIKGSHIVINEPARDKAILGVREGAFESVIEPGSDQC